MSAPEAHMNGWTLMPKFDVDTLSTHSSGSAHGDGFSAPCPVCRKAHGGRLVRSLVVSPIAPKTEKVGGEQRIDSRVLPARGPGPLPPLERTDQPLGPVVALGRLRRT